MSSELLPDQADLKRHEDTIERHLHGAIEVGKALKAIKDGALYLCYYSSFEQYVKDRWPFSQATAYRYIEEASPCQDRQNPSHGERDFAQFDTSGDEVEEEEVRPKPPERTTPKPPPEQPKEAAIKEKGPKDAAGNVIPDKLRPVFKAGERFRAIRAHQSRIQEEALELKRAGLLQDHHWRSIKNMCRNQDVIATNAEPKYICEACWGKGFDECGSCEGKAYLTHIQAKTR